MSYFQTLTGLNQIVADYVQTDNLSATNISGGKVNISSLDASRIVVSDFSRNLTSQALSNGQLLIGNNGSYTANAITASTNMLVSNGAGTISIGTVTNPTFGTIMSTSVTPARPVFSDAAHNLVSQDMQNGQLIIGSNGSYVMGTITAGSNLSVTNGAGSISIGTVASPTFTNITATGNALISGNATIAGTLSCASITNSAINTDTVTTTALTTGTATASNIYDTSLAASSPVFTDPSKKLVTQFMANGQLIIGNNGGYTIGSINPGGNTFITNSAGSIVVGVNPDPTFSSLTVSSFQPGLCLVGTNGSVKSVAVSTSGPTVLYNDPTNGLTVEPISTSSTIAYSQGVDTNGKPFAQFNLNPTLTLTSLTSDAVYIPSLSTGTTGTSLLGLYSPLGRIVNATIATGQLLVGTPTGFASTQLIAGNGISIATSSDYSSIIIGAATTSGSSSTASVTSTLQITGLASSTPHAIGVDISGNVVNITQNSGQLLIGNSAGGYSVNTLTAGSNIIITNGSGSIQIDMASSPIFTTVNLSANVFAAGGYAYTLPSVSDTLVTLSATQTLTNKTFTSPVINGSFVLNGLTASQLVASDASKNLVSLPLQVGQVLTGNAGAYSVASISAPTGSNIIVSTSSSAISIDMSTSPSFQTVSLTQNSFTSAGYSYTLPSQSDTLVGLTARQTITNKSLTSPFITGGTIDNTVIGSVNPTSATFSSLIASTFSTSNPVNVSSYAYTFPAGSDTVLTATASQGITNKYIDSSVIGATTPTRATFTSLNVTGVTPNAVVMTDFQSHFIASVSYASYLANFTSDPQTQINNLASQIGGISNGPLTITTHQTDHRDTLLTLQSDVSNSTDAFYTDIAVYKGGYGGIYSGFNDYAMGYVGCSLSAAVNVYGNYEIMRAVANGSGRTGVIIGNDILTVPPPDKGLYVSGGIRCKALASSTSSQIAAAADGTLFLMSSGTTSTPVYAVGGHTTNPSFPYSYTSGNANVLSATVTFGAGTYRVHSFWNLSVTNNTSYIQNLAGWVTDGSVQWARQAIQVPAGFTVQLGNTQQSFYSTYSNQTVTFTVVFASSGPCTINADYFSGSPWACTELVCNAVLA